MAASEVGGQLRHLRLGAGRSRSKDLQAGPLPPGGIEVQVLDHGYAEQYEKATGKKPDWFTTNGDVFPVGSSKMKPFRRRRPTASAAFRART